ncbi:MULTISPECIES: FKBP-type peptidyl-prolyl cis-trans isomerase [unclassified Dysgonomonas]|uniref:FKBP-type peptidyl-prolyl cis-trans isomerase n=1 Tax=unclassified Dysgonomonas TaxID=2630389 RepID=UPI000682606F|nr:MULTISPECIES: FKBP-type peptidyl-prolyl cis-trans isomerase [unclassified Dysgonomonas]MBD8349146.1 FKBP-type peptidyl-prolyl cis-trans isomerase [Dysgonomonas sp. HGC4]MBF0576645.1 FKBP-type peptidyl-prolyl cis-trans isomerase [Dysgonomonas sp. GY617]
MKKIFLSALLLASISTSVVYAKKNKKEAVKQINPVSLQTANDSILYAYGVSLAEQGLEQYLVQLNVITDTTAISSKYNALIANAATPEEKVRLNNELSSKLDSALVSNTQNIEMLLKGIGERLQAAEQNFAYGKGLEVGDQLNRMTAEFSKQVLGNDESVELNKQAILLGLTNAIKKEPILIANSNEMVQNRINALQQKEQEEKKQVNAEKIAAGEKFMAENSTKDGVVTLPDGLQYKVITQGTGAIPTAEDKVKVHYHGTLTDGTVFDSSVDRGEPITFGVTQVIPGWTQALQMMPVGSKWMLYIPYDLAYGDRDGGPIPAYSNLIFEVELLGIEK